MAEGIDTIKKYEVVLSSGAVEIVFAGSVSFTVSGDALFETENRDFQVVYARTHWNRITQITASN